MNEISMNCWPVVQTNLYFYDLFIGLRRHLGQKTGRNMLISKHAVGTNGPMTTRDVPVRVTYTQQITNELGPATSARTTGLTLSTSANFHLSDWFGCKTLLLTCSSANSTKRSRFNAQFDQWLSRAMCIGYAQVTDAREI